jgi:hypothetical protein
MYIYGNNNSKITKKQVFALVNLETKVVGLKSYD